MINPGDRICWKYRPEQVYTLLLGGKVRPILYLPNDPFANYFYDSHTYRELDIGLTNGWIIKLDNYYEEIEDIL